jgi:molecular chaperone GrpE
MYNARTMLEKDAEYEENEVFAEDEVTSEDLEMETEDESLKDKITSLRKKLSVCEDDKRKHLEELQRVRADFLNSKRRLDEQFLRDKERATDRILFELITLVDSFDTAMINKELWGTIDERWRVGVEAIHTKLLALLRSNNVVAVDPLGVSFNPEEHEAVSNTPVTDDTQIDTVVAVLQKGFKRNDTVIRPAMVVVGAKE